MTTGAVVPSFWRLEAVNVIAKNLRLNKKSVYKFGQMPDIAISMIVFLHLSLKNINGTVYLGIACI